MTIASLSDALRAYDEGRVHLQRFVKGSNLTVADGRWQDWSYAPGQPAYDARVGTPGRFNPLVASGNDAVYFPAVEPGQTRHLTEVCVRTVARGSGQLRVSLVVYDVVGVYPLIDGDSTDEQTFLNDVPLPRYSDGAGVFPVLVNHVAPALAPAALTMRYLDHAGVERSTQGGVLNGGAGVVCSAAQSMAVAGSFGALSMPLGFGSRGARAVTSLQFGAPPGGLFSMYMLRPLLNLVQNDGATGSNPQTVPYTRPVLQTHGWNAPRIHDGAHIGMFMMPVGNSQSVAQVYGHMEFIWG